jgi:hypothetical protein
VFRHPSKNALIVGKPTEKTIKVWVCLNGVLSDEVQS